MPGDKLKEQTKTKLQRKGEAYMSLAKSALTSDAKLQKYYNQLAVNMKLLTDQLNLLYTKDAEGNYPVLTEETLKDLREMYLTITIAAGLLEKESLKKSGSKSALHLASRKLSEIIAQDMSSLRKFHTEQRLSFPEHMKAAKTQLIKVEDQQMKTMGKFMSSRHAMSAVVRKGDQKVVIRGLFTQHSTAEDPVQLFESFFAQYFLDNHLDNNSTEVKAIAALRKIHNDEYPTIQDLLNDVYFYSDSATNRRKMNCSDSLQENRKFIHWYNQYCAVKDNNGKEQIHSGIFRMMTAYQDQIKKRVGIAGVNAKSGIRSGRRLDLRNSAMSAVADLLGMENLIAGSVPMKIQKGGKTIEGNFMSFAAGTDIKNMGADNEFGKMDPETMKNNTAVLKQAANLQILDFICGNTDRHLGNVFYQFDEHHRMTGIQGIDNDTSFGVIDREGLEGIHKVQNFRHLRTLGFIPEETAARLRDMNPQILRTSLQKYGLQKDEIDAACERYNLLLDYISKEYIDDDPGTFKRRIRYKNFSSFKLYEEPWLYVLNDEQIRCIDPDRNLSSSHLFNAICRIVNKQHKLAVGNVNLNELEPEQRGKWKKSMDEYQNMVAAYKEDPDLPEAEIITRPERQRDLQKFSEKIRSSLTVLEENNHGMFRGSQEYTNILHYAEIAAEVIHGTQNLNSVNTMIENLDALCTVYLDVKKADRTLKKNERSAKRAMAVQELQDLMKNMAEKLGENDHDCYCRLSALERAGAFRTRTDSAAIAGSIEQLQNTLNAGREPETAQLNMNGIFDRVTRATWQKMTDNYHTEIVCMTDLLTRTKGLPQSMKDRAEALIHAGDQMGASSEKMNQIRKELQKFRTAAENYQKTLQRRTMTINGKDTVIISNDQVEGLTILNRLIRLSEKADQGLVQPADLKERLAAMILENQTVKQNRPEFRQYLMDYSAFQDQMMDLTCQTEKELLSQCRKRGIDVSRNAPQPPAAVR